MESLDPRMPSPLLEAAEQFCTFELLPAMIPAPVDPVPVTVVLELTRRRAVSQRATVACKNAG